MKSALSAKQADGKLVVLDDVAAKSAKTGDLVKQIDKLGWNSALIIGGETVDENFSIGLDVLPQQGANVYDIMRRDTLVLTKGAVEHLVERLK